MNVDNKTEKVTYTDLDLLDHGEVLDAIQRRHQTELKEERLRVEAANRKTFEKLPETTDSLELL